ncbi:MAG: hypothetical protein ABFS03_05760 [Chloroflexota bacterium]
MTETKSQPSKTALPKSAKTDSQDSPVVRSRGGQPGNTNALKHGFYSSRCRERDLKKLELIEKKIDLTPEIELMRITIGRLLSYPQSELSIKDALALSNVITRATGRLGQLIRIQKKIGDSGMDEMFHEVLLEFAEEHNLG